MEGGHQRQAQLLAEIGQQEIEGRKGEAGVHQIGPQPFQGGAQLALGPKGRDCVHLALHQVGQGHLRVVAVAAGGGDVDTFEGRWTWAVDTSEPPQAAGGGVEVNETDAVPAVAQGMGCGQAVGDVAAKRRFLAQPGNVSHQSAPTWGER